MHGAPSALPYPDSAAERLGGPVAFGPRLEAATWAAVRALVASDAGLRMMVARLSTLPASAWWDRWTPEDRDGARRLFAAMRSGRGFALDCRQAGAEGAAQRTARLRAITCPTLVMASEHDGGVSVEHARSFASLIPGAQLVETDVPTHLFWLGPERPHPLAALRAFLHTP